MYDACTVQLGLQLIKEPLCPFVLHVKESEYSEITGVEKERREGKNIHGAIIDFGLLLLPPEVG